MVIYQCGNCLWEGSTDEMQAEGDLLLCPNCCAFFLPDDDEPSVWSVVSVEDDPEDTDYGDF